MPGMVSTQLTLSAAWDVNLGTNILLFTIHSVVYSLSRPSDMGRIGTRYSLHKILLLGWGALGGALWEPLFIFVSPVQQYSRQLN